MLCRHTKTQTGRLPNSAEITQLTFMFCNLFGKQWGKKKQQQQQQQKPAEFTGDRTNRDLLCSLIVNIAISRRIVGVYYKSGSHLVATESRKEIASSETTRKFPIANVQSVNSKGTLRVVTSARCHANNFMLLSNVP